MMSLSRLLTAINKKMRRNTRKVFIMVALGLSMLTGCAINIADHKSVPDTKLVLYEKFRGKSEITLDSLKGSPVIINFWGTWCPPCRAEMPDIQAFWEKRRDENLIIIGINTHDQEESARAFMHDIGITYPVAKDPSGNLAADFKVLGFPATFFVDRSGMIRNTWTGFMTPEQLRENARSILE
jgi:peroxiredoxin